MKMVRSMFYNAFCEIKVYSCITFLCTDETTPPPPKKQRCTPNTSDISNESPTLTDKLPEKDTSSKSKDETEAEKCETAQSPSSDSAPSIETDPVQSVSVTEPTDEKPDVEMAEPKPSTSQSMATCSPVQVDPVESTSSGSANVSPKSSNRAEKDYERRLLKKIQLNLQWIWRAIETNDSETSSNAINTSGTSTNSASSQPISSAVKPNEESAETVVPDEHQTTSQEQTSPSEPQI